MPPPFIIRPCLKFIYFLRDSLLRGTRCTNNAKCCDYCQCNLLVCFRYLELTKSNHLSSFQILHIFYVSTFIFIWKRYHAKILASTGHHISFPKEIKKTKWIPLPQKHHPFRLAIFIRFQTLKGLNWTGDICDVDGLRISCNFQAKHTTVGAWEHTPKLKIEYLPRAFMGDSEDSLNTLILKRKLIYISFFAFQISLATYIVFRNPPWMKTNKQPVGRFEKLADRTWTS